MTYLAKEKDNNNSQNSAILHKVTNVKKIDENIMVYFQKSLL